MRDSLVFGGYCYQIRYIIQEDVAETLWNKKAVWPDDIKTIAIQSYHPRSEASQPWNKKAQESNQ